MSTGQGVIGNDMFAYCLNNPINGSDPCGSCFHRLDFWNDCDKCGGKTLINKLDDFATIVIDYQVMVREDQHKQTELQLQLVNSIIQSQVRAEQEMAEQQRIQDILVGEYVAYRFSTPELAIESVKFVSWVCAGIAIFTKNPKLAVEFTKVAWGLEGLEFVIK